MITDRPHVFHKPSTAQEAVLAQLRRAIVSGELRPGEPIRQSALAERFGVSRVPLREALKILEGEGQVTYRPHRGYVVTELNMDDLLEVYRIRELLEGEAARRAVPRLSETDIATLGFAAAEVTRRPSAETCSPWPRPTGSSTSSSSTGPECHG